MNKNDGAKDNKGGRRMTRRAVLEAGFALGAMASTGSLAAYAASPDNVPQNSPEKGKLLDTVLRHYGMTLEEIEGWGGKFMKWLGRERVGVGFVREGMVDMMLGNIYLGYTPHNAYWHEATMLFDMRFLDFEKPLVSKLVKQFGYVRATLPHGLYRGVDRDIPSVGTDTIYIYCLESQPAKLVHLITEGLDKNSDLFKSTRSVLYYERDSVWKNPYIPLHPAAEAYYRSKGYMK